VSGNAAFLTLVFVGAYGVITAPNLGNTTAYNAWQSLSGNATAPAGTAYAYVEVYNTATSGVSRFDEVRATRQASLDNEVADGTTYGRPANADLYVSGGVNRVGLRIAGSGQQIGDQRNLKTRTVANAPALLPTAISYSVPIGSVSPCSVTISVAAWTLLAGSYSVAYNALSTTISLARNAAYTVYLYLDDPNQAGGSPALVATQTVSDLYAADGRVYVGGVIVSVPTTGSGSGGGGGGGAGGCVMIDQYIPGGIAGDVYRGDFILGTPERPKRLRWWLGQRFEVQGAALEQQPCVRATTDRGASVCASTTTPMTLPDGSMRLLPDMLGQRVYVRRTFLGIPWSRWERVAQIEDLGVQWVNHISIDGNCYFAGERKGTYINTHNTTVMPK
jgi:hypothetical protein